METLNKIFRTLLLVVAGMIGLFMALVFTFSTIIAIAILYVVSRFRGRSFSVQEYWTARQARSKSTFTARVRSRNDITDIEARDIP